MVKTGSIPGIYRFFGMVFLLGISFCFAAGNNVDVLKGKLIVLDPGHGIDEGARGANGLVERDLNLKIAQRLKSELVKKGALVYLTRDSNTSPFSEQKVAVSDLAARVKFATDLKCDLFVSIHHNTNAQEDRSINQSEVYYNINDEGPSRDLAELLNTSFAKELGTRKGFQNAMPSTSYELKNANNYPAILGKACYIINPQAEMLLNQDDYQKKETLAYLEAIETYYQRGICGIYNVSPTEGSTITDLSKFEITARGMLDASAKAFDPNSLLVQLDGQRIKSTIKTDKIIAYPGKELSNGLHTLTMDIKNMNGNAAMQSKTSFLVSLPPKFITLKMKPSSLPPTEVVDITLAAQVMDARAEPVADGTMVTFLADNVYLDSSLTRRGVALTVAKSKSYIANTQFTALLGSIATNTVLLQSYGHFGLISGQVMSSSGHLMESVKIKIGNNVMGESDRNGYFYLENLLPGRYTLSFQLPGFEPTVKVIELPEGEAVPLNVVLQPYADSIFHDQTFILDPAYGGSQSGPVGLTGLSSSITNLKMGNYLKNYLTAAGAKVVMTRENQESLSDIQKVLLDTTTQCNNYLILAHGGNLQDPQLNRPAVYYSSPECQSLAQCILQEINAFNTYSNLSSKTLSEGLLTRYSEYLIEQTNAIRIEPSLITNPFEEKRLTSDAYLQFQAYAMFCGILLNAGIDTSTRGHISGMIKDITTGAPLTQARIELDDGMIVPASDWNNLAIYQFRYIKEGAHRMTVSCPGYQNQTVALLVKSGETIPMDISLLPLRNQN